jgi:hypothetical protein
MQISKNKTNTIALLLIFTISTSIAFLPEANAHSPPWSIPTWAYVVPAPLHCQTGTQMTFIMWLTLLPPSSSATNDWNWRGLKLTLTKPSGATEVLGGPAGFTSDSTGSCYTTYTPDEIGNWTATISFPGQVYGVSPPFYIGNIQSNAFYNDTFQASSYTTYFQVQEEPLEVAPLLPYPNEYWTRPIEGQNSNWYTIGSNWLGGTWVGGVGGGSTNLNFQKDGTGPESSHIMWTRPLEDGGIVGGSRTGEGLQGNAYYDGSFYNLRFQNSIIMHGRLYYQLPLGNAGTGGGYMCVDLRTGQQIWRKDLTTYPDEYEIGTGKTNQSAPTFGYLYAFEMMNQHGVSPSWLFQSNFARAIDPLTGAYVFNVTDVPTGTEAIGPAGEWLRYIIRNSGNTTNPSWRLIQWNSSKVFQAQTSGSVNASIFLEGSNIRTDWNVSINYQSKSSTWPSSSSIQAVQYGDLILGRNGSLSTNTNYQPYITYWAISLKPESRGDVLWMKNIPAPPNNMTMITRSMSEGVFILQYQETQQWLAYDMHTGDLLWGPSEPEVNYNAYGYYTGTSTVSTASTIAYGRFYSYALSGMIFAYDLLNGTILWRDEFPTNRSVWNYYPQFLLAVADGKGYFGTNEHSSNKPLFKGEQIRCINLTDGKELWASDGWGGLHAGAVADGCLVYHNCYDGQIYCIGKGSSAIKVTASPKVSMQGNDVFIEGTVIDTAAGTAQEEQKARFPDGVPAVSDDSMGAWMDYVYLQKPKPTDATGVQIKIDVIDSNGNYRNIGETTSDANGFYSFQWTPDISGKYTVIAAFAGSKSYWPSHAETAFVVNDAAPTPTQQPVTAPPPTDMYVLGIGTAIIIAIAIVGAILLLAIRKRP